MRALVADLHLCFRICEKRFSHDESYLQLLDEMLDNGFPLAVEANILKELIKPPNFLRTIADTITGKTTG